MHVDSFIIDHFDVNDAHIVENKTYELMIHMQLNVNVKTNYHIFNVFVQ
jgi:pentose-5-phosphate-3-epimerase